MPIPLAIAGESGTRELHMQGRHGVQLAVRHLGEAVRIECITLADAFARWDIERCDFLKLDCEGAEYEILLRAPSDVYARIHRVALEYHDWITDHTTTSSHCSSRFTAEGTFRGHDARSRGVADAVCVREEKGSRGGVRWAVPV